MQNYLYKDMKMIREHLGIMARKIMSTHTYKKEKQKKKIRLN